MTVSTLLQHATLGKADHFGTTAALTKKGKEQLRTEDSAALRPFLAALANRDSAPVNILYLGDSITEGQAATTAANRWIAKLRDSLRSRFPTSGVPGGVGFIPPYRDATSLPQPASLSAALRKGAEGLGLGARIAELAATETLTWTVTGTAVDIVYAQSPTGGTFTFATSNDGGTSWSAESAAVDCHDPSLFTDMLYQRVTFTRPGTWQVRITSTAAGGFYAHMGGIVVYNGGEGTVGSEATTGKGIRMFEGGHFGSTSTQWAAYPYITRWARRTAPSIVVIELATNDYAGNIDPATSKANLQTIIAAVRSGVAQAGTPPPSIVLLALNQRTGTFTYSWPDYVQAMHDIAAADDHITVFDLSLRMAAVSDNSLGFFADAVHPTDKGHRAIAEYLTAFLVGEQVGNGQHGNELHPTPFALAIPLSGYKSGTYIGSSAPAGNITTQPANGDLRLSPLVINTGNSVAFDKLSTYVATGGSTGALARIVIYSDNGYGYPGALLHDSGQIAATTSTAEVTEAAFAGITLAPGLYWVGVVTQGAPTTAPIYVGVSGRSPFVGRQNVQAASGTATGYNATGITGAPPSTWTATAAVVGSAVDVLLRAA